MYTQYLDYAMPCKQLRILATNETQAHYSLEVFINHSVMYVDIYISDRAKAAGMYLYHSLYTEALTSLEL